MLPTLIVTDDTLVDENGNPVNKANIYAGYVCMHPNFVEDYQQFVPNCEVMTIVEFNKKMGELWQAQQQAEKQREEDSNSGSVNKSQD